MGNWRGQAAKTLKAFRQDVRSRWMLWVAWLLAIVFAIEHTVTEPPQGIVQIGVRIVTAMLIVAMPFSAKVCSVVMIVVQAVFLLVPVSVGGTPFWAIWFALGVAGYYFPVKISIGLLAVEDVALGLSLMMSGASVSYVLSNWMSMFFLFLAAWAAGAAITWNQRLREAERSRMRMERMQQQIISARNLHDALSGQLSYLALLSERCGRTASAAKDSEAFRELHDGSIHALESLHSIIDMLTDDEDHQPLLKPSQRPAVLQSLVRERDAELKNIGIQGSAFVADGIGTSLSDKAWEELLSLVQELYSNMARHGSEGSTYTIRIGSTDEGVRITQSNTFGRGSMRSLPKGGNGLATHKKTLRMLGGRLTANRDGDEWMCRAFIPVEGKACRNGKLITSALK